MTVNTEKLFYSPREAAQALSVGRTQIFKLMADGRLERRRLGARTLIPASSLQAFAESLLRKQGSAS
jgi:excisionase family DNA binding protein